MIIGFGPCSQNTESSVQIVANLPCSSMTKQATAVPGRKVQRPAHTCRLCLVPDRQSHRGPPQPMKTGSCRCPLPCRINVAIGRREVRAAVQMDTTDTTTSTCSIGTPYYAMVGTLSLDLPPQCSYSTLACSNWWLLPRNDCVSACIGWLLRLEQHSRLQVEWWPTNRAT